MSYKFLKGLRNFDRQLFMWFDPQRGRWLVMRMGERYGVPRLDWSQSEIKRAKEKGAIWEILLCQANDGSPMHPSWWILDYLRQRDARRINFKQYVREMDDRNEKRKEKARADATDRLDYRIKEDWRNIRDELRGDTMRRRYVLPVK